MNLCRWMAGNARRTRTWPVLKWSTSSRHSAWAKWPLRSAAPITRAVRRAEQQLRAGFRDDPVGLGDVVRPLQPRVQPQEEVVRVEAEQAPGQGRRRQVVPREVPVEFFHAPAEAREDHVGVVHQEGVAELPSQRRLIQRAPFPAVMCAEGVIHAVDALIAVPLAAIDHDLDPRRGDAFRPELRQQRRHGALVEPLAGRNQEHHVVGWLRRPLGQQAQPLRRLGRFRLIAEMADRHVADGLGPGRARDVAIAAGHERERLGRRHVAELVGLPAALVRVPVPGDAAIVLQHQVRDWFNHEAVPQRLHAPEQMRPAQQLRHVHAVADGRQHGRPGHHHGNRQAVRKG